jgi:FkbM family methyltransferase
VHEPDTLEFITNNCSNGGIIHAGAGFGDFFPALSKSCKSTVWTFEPDDENYFCAKKTIELNHLKNINLFNYGLGQNKKQVYLQNKKDNKSLGPRCEISEVFINEEGTSYKPISLHSLDTIIPETSKISIIHLDVEGYELEVLQGFDDFLENSYLKNLYENEQAEVFSYISNKDSNIGGNHAFTNTPGGWLNHYKRHFTAYHYMSAIFKMDLVNKMNGGFCEQYKDGICYDDNDFIKYLIHNNFTFKIPEFNVQNPFCIHLYHDKVDSLNYLEYHSKNKEVYIKRMEAINATLVLDIHAQEVFMPKPVIL